MAAPTTLRGHCPQCGAESQLYDIRCWLCGWSPPALGAPGSAVEAPPVIVAAAKPRELEPFQYSIGGLLVVTTVIAVCLGALRAAPGLGILLILFLAVAVVPATIRARVVRKRSERDDSPRGRSERSLAFFESFAITAAAIIVGLVVCGVVGFVALWIACASGSSPGTQVANRVTVVLFFGSPVIGLLVAGLIYWLAWPQSKVVR